MRTLITRIGRLHTCDAQDRVLEDASIVVENGRIAEVRTGTPEGWFDQRLDLSGCIVMPGLVNLHHHFFQTLTRAIPLGLSGHLMDWLRAMYPLWARITPDDLAAATQASMAELLLTGATTSVDHAYLVPRCDPAYTDALVGAALESGMRLHLVSGAISTLETGLEDTLTPLLGPQAGGLVNSPEAVLADMRRSLRHHDPRPGARTRVALGATTTDYGRLDVMRRIADLASEAGSGLHVHFHPRPDERALCRERFGKSPLEVLDGTGWVRPGTWFAHSTRVDAADMRRMAEAGVAVAHCPRMILRLGARVTPVHDMLAAGIRVGFGVDGGASNDAGSMLGELRLALLMHRVAGGQGEVPWQQWLSPGDALAMATRGAAAILGRDDIGQIAPGLCADITGFDLSGVGYAGARTDWLAGLLLAGSDTRAALTMVGGGLRVWRGRLVGDDEHHIRARVDRATARLIDEAAAASGLDYRRMAGTPA